LFPTVPNVAFALVPNAVMATRPIITSTGTTQKIATHPPRKNERKEKPDFAGMTTTLCSTGGVNGDGS
jgi:hypothetical protein